MLIRLSRNGTSVSPSAVEIDAAREAFRSRHLLELPSLVAADLLRVVTDALARESFVQRVHDRLRTKPVDLVNEGVASAVLTLALNDPAVLEFVRTVTAIDGVRGFGGVAQRRVAGAGHGDEWHNDLADGRLVALTIHLGAQPFAGGLLQLRDESRSRIVAEWRGREPGDAALFKLDRDLRHRVTPIEGTDASRTVYAGWFTSTAVPLKGGSKSA